jgi:hypothetical protein
MHFENSFNPKQDVIYGTGDWIHVYLYNYWFIWPYGYPALANITSKGRTYEYRSLNPYDTKNPDNVDKVTAAAHDKYGTNVINNYNVSIKSNLFKSEAGAGGPKIAKKNNPQLQSKATDSPSLAEEHKKYDDYFKCLEQSVGYGPGSLMTSVTEMKSALDKYEQFGELDMSKKKDQGKLPGIVSDIAIRRSCKFGIHYFVERNNAQLHYILDGMDVDAIVKKKQYTNESTGKGKVPICTSEVRYIFRHWERLQKTARLLFYLNFVTVPAPWDNNRYTGTWMGWADYAIQRMAKHGGGAPLDMKKKFDDAMRDYQSGPGVQGARKVLDAFHSIPSRFVNDPADDTLKIT